MKKECGDCQLCCELVPVEEIGKKAGHKCGFQEEGVGCSIYINRPISCRFWDCGWLVMDEAKGLKRPDQSHYVIHPESDTVTMDNDGVRHTLVVMVIWIDPKFPDAHEDPKLRYLLNKNKIIAKLNYDSVRAKLLVPPSVNDEKKWIIKDVTVDWNTPRAQAALAMGLVDEKDRP
jgi:hypothetical protein